MSETSISRLPHRIQRGISMIELMIAMAIGLVVLGGVITIFTNTAATRDEIEKTSRQIENGRYAMQILTEDLQMAGYLGEFVPSNNLSLAALPDPCQTDLNAIGNIDPGTGIPIDPEKAPMVLHIQGVNNGATQPSCISDVKNDTDVIVIRRASTCTSSNPAETNCDTFSAGTPYLQVSGCNSDPPNSTGSTRRYSLSTSAAGLTLQKVGCTAVAPLRRYRTHIYFIANNNLSGDGIPTLKRAELAAGGFNIVPLVEGIEQLQIEYGIDTSASPGDGIPDSYTATPATVSDWWNTMAVRVYLLARNDTASGAYTDKKTYTLGGTDYGPFNDHYRRSAYTSAVKLANPAGRRE